MIIRKPYAFLIKNFKKIHIFLFLLCSYILYKTVQLSSFIKEFVELGTYDAYNEPISNYITFTAYLFLIFIIASSVAILILLRKKNKPWKMYITPIVTYVNLFITFIFVSNFFAGYTGSIETTTPRAIQDIIFILTIPQYLNFLILSIRILGIDLNKFDFKSDAEFLELSESDRDEMEINIDIDKASFKRFIRRFKRNAGYYIKEHKKAITIIIAITTAFIGFESYKYIFITNKSYKEGELLNSSGYEITINDSYYSNKDYKGNVITKNSSFIILDVTIKNNAQKRKINFARFHIMNGTSNYSPTAKKYETQFQDLGTAYEEKTIEQGESFNTILIYKVDSKEKINRFVLYYQEFNDDNTNHLRKIKLKLNDLSEVKVNNTLNLYETLKFKIGKTEKEIIFDSYEIKDTVSYNKEDCKATNCTYDTVTETAKEGYQILKIDFVSNEFDGKDMIDFLSRYGTINYIDSNNKKYGIKIENGISTRQYYGKYIFVKIPTEMIEAQSVELAITVRNNKYTYKIK